MLCGSSMSGCEQASFTFAHSTFSCILVLMTYILYNIVRNSPSDCTREGLLTLAPTRAAVYMPVHGVFSFQLLHLILHHPPPFPLVPLHLRLVLLPLLPLLEVAQVQLYRYMYMYMYMRNYIVCVNETEPVNTHTHTVYFAC